MTVERRNGWIVVSDFVTDGADTWLETQRYLYYTQREARSLFREHVRENGWKVAK
jgi:hypothetical protein